MVMNNTFHLSCSIKQIIHSEFLITEVTDKGDVCAHDLREHNKIYESCLSEMHNISMVSKTGLVMSLESKNLEVLMCFHENELH